MEEPQTSKERSLQKINTSNAISDSKTIPYPISKQSEDPTSSMENSNHQRRIPNFRVAKKTLSKIYQDRPIDFYCSCNFYKSIQENYNTTRIDSQCGLRARSNRERAFRVEWEHIVPAYEFGKNLSCWTNELCEKNGKSYKGRKCCRRIDNLFNQMESDLHNLRPAPGEINADRNNFAFGMIPGEIRQYGTCDFEVDFQNKVAEPREAIRGDIARTYFYMMNRYKLTISKDQLQILLQWNREDPPDHWEKERNTRIEKIQGNSNPYINEAL